MTETRKFDAEVAKVLKLVIHSLYTNKDIFLRELISNAADASDKRRFLGQSDPKLANESEYRIKITLNPKKRELVITDNGIGMSHDELIANLGTIAKSGTGEFLEQLDEKNDVDLIGQFGVGFYSSFMVADKVTVKSRKAGEKKAHIWESKGDGEYTVGETDYADAGTEIILHLRKDAQAYLDKHKISHIITTYSDHVSIPVILIDEEGKEAQVNKGKALWTRPKAEITPEEYQQFYKTTSHQVDKPFLTLHGKAEGKIEYTYLLFVPSMKPFDLYHPDRMRRVKLFVHRVFIAEDTLDVIPRWLRFLRGVVDSDDLPLNVSRETLQANPVLEKIKKSITNKVISELKKKSTKDPEAYEIFWKNFGPVLKEGLCETLDAKEPLLEICRFNSTHSNGITSIDDYISRMKPEQEDIYYLSGENLESLRDHPQLEGFAKRGLEVLFFTDNVDDFWVNIAHDYKGKKFKSVTRADIDLHTQNGEVPKVESKELTDLVALFKKELGEKVKDVVISKKLESSPVCLGVAEGDMDIRMEKFLRENKQLPYASSKILEINPEHKLILALSVKGETEEVRDLINILYDQALIIEGETLTDLKGFSSRLNHLLEKALAA